MDLLNQTSKSATFPLHINERPENQTHSLAYNSFPWTWPEDGEDRWWLNWLEDKPWTTLFVDGNHENFDAPEQLPERELFGGRVHELRPHVFHLMRGYVFEIPTGIDQTARCFVMGGAASSDRAYRRPGASWWPQEIPSDAEFARDWAALEACGFEVDYVLTHECGGRWTQAAGKAGDGGSEPDEARPLHDFLDKVEDTLSFKRWYFGHHHADANIGERHTLLYQQVVELGE